MDTYPVNALNAHDKPKGDPKVDGPYLDDIRADEARARFNARNANAVKPEKKGKKDAHGE